MKCFQFGRAYHVTCAPCMDSFFVGLCIMDSMAKYGITPVQITHRATGRLDVFGVLDSFGEVTAEFVMAALAEAVRAGIECGDIHATPESILDED